MKNVWYKVNTETKEHELLDNAVVELIEKGHTVGLYGYRFVKADADGWIEWKGGECPLLGGSLCAIKLRDGATVERKCAEFRWKHHNLSTDIIAYRPIVEPQAEQVKEWRGPEDGLPPVGTQVGVIDDGTLRYGADECGPVIAHVEDCAVVRMSYGLGCFQAGVLFPILTDRERWIEAAKEAAFKSGSTTNYFEAIYDAGLARLPD